MKVTLNSSGTKVIQKKLPSQKKGDEFSHDVAFLQKGSRIIREKY